LLDLAIKGKIYRGRIARGWVYVEGGRIARIHSEQVAKAEKTIVLEEDQVLIPAATDLHVHLRDWDQADKETVETATRSAIAGGVTTVAEMPNTVPKLDNAEVVRKRLELLTERSYTDYAVQSGVPEDIGELARLKEAGAFGVKFYPGDLPRLPSLVGPCTKLGLKVVVHAEAQSLVDTERDALAEDVAVGKILETVSSTTDLRFAHISTSSAVKAISRLRRASRPRPFRSSPGLTLEVAPHHLFVDEALAGARIGAASRVRPPLRPTSNVLWMRKAFERGVFDFYATDHAPHTLVQKYQGRAPGFPGLEIALPLLLTRTGGDIDLAVETYCRAPAQYLGMKKGSIRRGWAADMVVISPKRWKIDPEEFVSMGRVTPFAGEELHYSVDNVIKAGEVAFEDGRLTERKPVQRVP
jgi:dihydroorotase